MFGCAFCLLCLLRNRTAVGFEIPIRLQKANPNEALKLFRLTKEHTQVEMMSWVRKFKAYFSSSNFSAWAIAEQQAYFRSVIDVNLETRIADRVLSDTPVFSDRENVVSCISI